MSQSRVVWSARSAAVQLASIAAVAIMAAAGTVAVTPAAVAAAPTPSEGAPLTSAGAPTQPDERSALQQARASNQRVEVMSERTPFSQIFAEPSGRLTYESTVMPERTRMADGSWKDIDLNLQPDGGVLRPKASAADVRFSADGSGPLVTLVRQGKTLTLTWPAGGLRRPTVSRDSATYAEVLPGVDLVVRATPMGFTHVLTVKSAAAAENSQLRAIRFKLGGNARTLRQADGSLMAVANGVLVATAPSPAMWDSRTAPPAPRASGVAAADGGSSPEPSSAVSPGDSARVAAVATEVTQTGDLVLRPDPALLAAPAASPVFIDPAWNVGKSRWAYATNNNSNNTDTSIARVGKDPDSGKVYRSFFEFPTSGLNARHVESAYVQMKLDHSWSCTRTWSYMFHSGVLSGTPRTAWSTSLIKRLAAAESSANEGSGCADSPQPDMVVNFTGGYVTALMQSLADKGTSAITIGFSAGNENGDNETATDRWKKFFPSNAKLIADIDAKPGKPHSVQVNGVACGGDIRLGVLDPYFSAVFPDGDAGQAIKGTWEWAEVASNGSLVGKPAPPQTSVPANARATTARVSGAVSERRYAVRTRGTDPAPYGITGPWSDWCYFVVDRSVPSVTATLISAPEGPGRPATFRIDSPAADVRTFLYGWESTTLSVAAAASGSGRSATVTVTPPKYGLNTLNLQAIDGTNNKGYGSVTFQVARPSPAVARWGLEIYPGVGEPAALSDTQPVLAGDTDLTPQGTTNWVDKGRLVGARNFASTGGGHLTTSSPVVDTTRSFSVAAWARLDHLNTPQTLVAQEGVRAANFALQYRTDDRSGDGQGDSSWCFLMNNADTDGSHGLVACAVGKVAAGRWTHVAGGYDAATRKLRVWVDGVLWQEVDAPAAWRSESGIRIGLRKYSSNVWHDPLIGSVADVHVFDRLLVQHDFTGMSKDDELSGGVAEPGMLQPIEVGRWDFESAVRCYDPGIENTCEAPDVGTQWGLRLSTTQGGEVGQGYRSRGLILDGTHFAEDPTDPFHGMHTREYGVSQRNTAPAGEPARWQDTPVLRTDQSFTVSVWVRPERLDIGNSVAVGQKSTRQSPFHLGMRSYLQNGAIVHFWEIAAIDRDSDLNEQWLHVHAPRPVTADDLGEWTHLVGVFDTMNKQLRLYVNGRLVSTGALDGLWAAAGPLTVGSAWWSPDHSTGDWFDPWHGGIDELAAYQGALSTTQVQELHRQQATPTV